MNRFLLGKMAWAKYQNAAGEYGDEGGSAGGDAGDSGDDGGDAGSEGGAVSEGLPDDGDIDDWMTPEAREVFEYDPFAPKEEGEKKKEGGEDGEPGEGEAAKAEDAEKKKDEPGEVKEDLAGDKTSREKELADQLAWYQAQMHKQLEGQVGGKEEKGEKEEEDPLDQVPQYQAFNIPPQIQEMIFSDDRQKNMQGLGMALQAVAQITHMNVRKEMSGMMDERISKGVESGQRQLTAEQQKVETQKSIKADWSKEYPDLAGEDLAPLVQGVAKRVCTERGFTEWNATTRDAIAGEVRKILGRGAPAAGAESGEAPKPKQEKKVPYQSKGSSRRGGGQGPDKTQQDIADTLGL